MTDIEDLRVFTEVQIYVSVQYPAVVKRYRERVQRVPEDSAARVELGKALTKCGRYVEAARELRLAAQDPVVRAQALHECAVANYLAGNSQQAVADGSAAKAANPEKRTDAVVPLAVGAEDGRLSTRSSARASDGDEGRL